ncbi:hypothetical protein DPMN_016163 [Dreissena polymorpha]|uniref:Uncharacterized protein n=1 Tax=Dreissena polymorpha TaxID=45954 RepID=A0A9D4S573_DREPO|nr:hypothetical protein DPMN_016163 [Dreissena polymorpha]
MGIPNIFVVAISVVTRSGVFIWSLLTIEWSVGHTVCVHMDLNSWFNSLYVIFDREFYLVDDQTYKIHWPDEKVAPQATPLVSMGGLRIPQQRSCPHHLLRCTDIPPPPLL